MNTIPEKSVPMILYIFATTMEAAFFVEACCFQSVPAGFHRNLSLTMKTRTGNIVLITGMGPVAASIKTEKAIGEYSPDIIINTGICGALTPALPCYEKVIVKDTIDGDLFIDRDVYQSLTVQTPSHHTRNLQGFPLLTLATVKEPVFGGPEKDQLQTVAQIVDMEGHSINKVCHRFQTPLLMIKVISDFADSHGKKHIHENLSNLSRLLLNCISFFESENDGNFPV